MPPSLVHKHHGVRLGIDHDGYLSQVQVHRSGVAEWKNEPGGLAVLRAYRAKDIGRFCALIAWR
jgi:hypothetical protein